MLPLFARARMLGLSMALATGSLGVVATIPASANGPVTWGVQAGNLDDLTFTSVSQEILTFYNARTFVHPGDHVLFTPVGGHTVTFNPIRIPGVPTFAYVDPAFPSGPTGDTLSFANRPEGALLNSGGFSTPGPGGPPVPATFTLNIGSDAAGEAGATYQYFCMLHRDMTGFITVLPEGARLPFTTAQNDQRAQVAMTVDLARGKAALGKAHRNVKDHRVAAGLGLPSVQGAGADSILRFAPATIQVNVGDSVTWTNEDVDAPHTVTFGEEIADTSGLGPGFLSYGGTSVNSSADQVNSGWLISQELIDYLNAGSLIPPSFTVGRTVTFSFNTAGTYHYICALHDTLGMVGTVIVRNGDNGGG